MDPSHQLTVSISGHINQIVSSVNFCGNFVKLKQKNMDNFVALGRRIDVFRPNHVISNLVTFFELLLLIDDDQYQAVMECFILLNPNYYIFKYNLLKKGLSFTWYSKVLKLEKIM